MNAVFKITLSSFLVASASLVASVPEATARSVPAIAGRAVSVSNLGCVIPTSNEGTLLNQCNSFAPIRVPLPIDNFNSKNVSVTIRDFNSPASSCFVRAESRTQSSRVFSSTVSPTGSAFQVLTFSAVTVPFNGQLILDCTLAIGAFLGTVNYNS